MSNMAQTQLKSKTNQITEDVSVPPLSMIKGPRFSYPKSKNKKKRKEKHPDLVGHIRMIPPSHALSNGTLIMTKQVIESAYEMRIFHMTQ